MNLRRALPGILFIVISLIFFMETFNFPVKPGRDVGSAFWPRILIAILIILCIALIVSSLRKKNGEGAAETVHAETKELTAIDSFEDAVIASTELEEEGTNEKPKSHWKPILGILTCIVFVLLFEVLGFVISVFLLFTALGTIMFGKLERKMFTGTVVQALFLTVIVYLLFGKLLTVKLPQGIFFF